MVVNMCLNTIDYRMGFIFLFIFYFLKILFFFFKDFIYLFVTHRQGERGRDIGRGRSRLHAGSLIWDSIPGLQNHALS